MPDADCVVDCSDECDEEGERDRCCVCLDAAAVAVEPDAVWAKYAPLLDE